MIRKIAFIRSIEIQQASPYLSEIKFFLSKYNIEAKLFYTDGNCEDDDFPGEHEKIKEDDNVVDISNLIISWGAEGVISLSIPDENSIRDAQIKRRLEDYGIPVVMHNPHTTYLFSNKWETKETVSKFEILTAPGIFIDGDLLNSRGLRIRAYKDFIKQQCEELGYPLLSKPLWDSLGNGIKFLLNENDLISYLETPFDGNCIIEKFLDGELCSVEVIGYKDIHYFQPIIWKGRTYPSASFPFTQVRHSVQSIPNETHFKKIEKKLRTMCSRLSICGAIEVEMIYSKGEYYIVEINPRTSGSTSLSIASSGFNTYEALVHILMGDWGVFCREQEGKNRKIAVQFPFIERINLENDYSVNVIRSSNFNINDKKYANAIINFDKENLENLSAWTNKNYKVLDSVNQLITELSSLHLEDQPRTRDLNFGQI